MTNSAVPLPGLRLPHSCRSRRVQSRGPGLGGLTHPTQFRGGGCPPADHADAPVGAHGEWAVPGPGCEGRRGRPCGGRRGVGPAGDGAPRRTVGGAGRIRPRGSARDVADRALRHLARADARGADVQTLGGPVDDGAHLLDVGIPTTLRPPVGVTDVHSERRLLAADLAHRCHDTPTSSKNLWVSRKG